MGTASITANDTDGTVNPLNSNHIGDWTFGLFSAVGPFSEVLL